MQLYIWFHLKLLKAISGALLSLSLFFNFPISFVVLTLYFSWGSTDFKRQRLWWGPLNISKQYYFRYHFWNNVTCLIFFSTCTVLFFSLFSSLMPSLSSPINLPFHSFFSWCQGKFFICSYDYTYDNYIKDTGFKLWSIWR